MIYFRRSPGGNARFIIVAFVHFLAGMVVKGFEMHIIILSFIQIL